MANTRDSSLEEYKQALWQAAQKERVKWKRAVLLREIERINEKGREALRESLTAE